jgi:hypothetical protein
MKNIIILLLIKLIKLNFNNIFIFIFQKILFYLYYTFINYDNISMPSRLHLLAYKYLNLSYNIYYFINE